MPEEVLTCSFGGDRLVMFRPWNCAAVEER